jgi:hypothetical protein
MTPDKGLFRLRSLAKKATPGWTPKRPTGARRLRPYYLFYLVSFLDLTMPPRESLNQRERRLNPASKMAFRMLAWSGDELRPECRYLTSKPTKL